MTIPYIKQMLNEKKKKKQKRVKIDVASVFMTIFVRSCMLFVIISQCVCDSFFFYFEGGMCVPYRCLSR